MNYQKKLEKKRDNSALYRNEDQYGDLKVIKQSDAILQGLVIVRSAINPKIRRLILKSYCICIVHFEKGKQLEEWPLTDVVSVTPHSNRKCFQITVLEHKNKRNNKHTSKKKTKVFETRSAGDADIWLNGIKKACGVAYNAVPGLDQPSVGATDAWQPTTEPEQVLEPSPLHRSRSMSDPATPTGLRKMPVRLGDNGDDDKESLSSDGDSSDEDLRGSRPANNAVDKEAQARREQMFPSNSRASASVPNLPFVPDLTVNAPSASPATKSVASLQSSPADLINWFDSPRKDVKPAGATNGNARSPASTQMATASSPMQAASPAAGGAPASATNNLLLLDSPRTSRRRSRSVGLTGASSLSVDIFQSGESTPVATTPAAAARPAEIRNVTMMDAPLSLSPVGQRDNMVAGSPPGSKQIVFLSTSAADPKAVDHLGIVSATATVGLPSQPAQCSQAIEAARASAQRDLEQRAKEQGANALVGIGYSTSVHHLGVSVMAYGTACILRSH